MNITLVTLEEHFGRSKQGDAEKPLGFTTKGGEKPTHLERQKYCANPRC
jgi:hypothetical protein